MRSTAERRLMILSVLCGRRSELAENLAAEFGVTQRTIYNDIQILSCSYPIITIQGNGGGIKIMDGYKLGMKYLTDKQLELLTRLSDKLTDEDDRETLKIIIFSMINDGEVHYCVADTYQHLMDILRA